MLAFGLMLQFPVVLFVLSRLGVVTPAWLASRRRWAILIIAIVSAVATPGGDPFSMVILALFMYGLFEVTLLVVRALQRNSSASGISGTPGASGTDVDR
jgi:sec-independent protein translocase protein TatC